MSLISRFKSARALRLAGAALTALVGVGLLLLPAASKSRLGEWWTLRSYDSLFHLRPPIDVSNGDVVVIDMDDESQIKFGEVHIRRWDRALHTRLLKKLREQEAEAVTLRAGQVSDESQRKR